ncbi:hypothetical protein X797_009404 [Metarhizium robertsii]|uniref:C2H2-type domain-containing protein n=1 Tax=Metarhizium robertsii TaxID=568076 RepID=A0A014PLK1_9HYPO|nr:hypothetical protein X797_009404 [Metarhizium robertsii]
MADAYTQNGELAISKAQDIYLQAEKCRLLFSTYLKMFQLPTPYRWHVLNNECRFLTWARTLGVFDHKSIRLDRRLRFSHDFKELFMLMLSVLEEGLEQTLLRHPPINTVVENDAAMFAITGAISRLERLVPMIQIHESPVAREALLIRRRIAREWGDKYAPYVSQLIQRLFPGAEPTLRAQLTLSILYRRGRLIHHLLTSDRLQYEMGTENANPGASRSQQQGITGGIFSYPPEEKRARWLSHLKADLQPYVCLSAECRHFLMYFSTVEEWKGHMESHDADWFQNIHSTRWSCPFCNDSSTCFLTKGDLEDHLIHDEATSHPGRACWNTLTVERSVVPKRRNRDCCPLCNEELTTDTPSERPHRLYTHIIDHLDELAWVSIYWWNVESYKRIGVSVNSTDSVDVQGGNPQHRCSGAGRSQGQCMKRKLNFETKAASQANSS